MRTRFAVVALFLGQQAVAHTYTNEIPPEPVRRSVKGVEFLGTFSIDGNYEFRGTTVGGISGLTFDSDAQVYYALSNDQNEPRFYTIEMEVVDDFVYSDIDFIDVTFLKTNKGDRFNEGDLKPEGIVYIGHNLYISTEGNKGRDIDPAVMKFNLAGFEKPPDLALPVYYCPRGDDGVRPGSSFKALTVSPDGKKIWTAVESALKQDGSSHAPSRMLEFDRDSRHPEDEFVYEKFGDNGLVGLVALDDDGTFLALERNTEGGRKSVRLYEVYTQGALNVRGVESLADSSGDPHNIVDPVGKTLIADFDEDLGLALLDYQAMDVVVDIHSGHNTYKLVLISNNGNFDDTSTRFVGLEIKINDSIGLAEVEDETPEVLHDEDIEETSLTLFGEAMDPAIWIHPDDPTQSLVIGTLVDGGLATFNLDGNLVQRIRRNGNVGNLIDVEIMYAVPVLAGRFLEDLVIATNNEEDRLVIFFVDKKTRMLEGITSESNPLVFPDDPVGESAYGLTTYTSPYTGDHYVFVSQTDGNKIAQVRLFAEDDGMSFEHVRFIILPDEDASAQARGLVVDRELGNLYIAAERQTGILRTEAEPDEKDSGFDLVENADDPKIKGKLKGMTIYYEGGKAEGGYLIVSSEGDSSFFVYERQGENDFVGRFAVTEDDNIDHVSSTEGISVINVNLGPEFPCGLFVAQDSSNTDAEVDFFPDTHSLENIKSNFKLVAWDEIAKTFEKKLGIDTKGWGPRRFALVIRLDDISESIFKAFIEKDLSPRDAENFLFDLDEAAFRLYKHGTRRRRMFSPVGRDSCPRGKAGKKGDRDLQAVRPSNRGERHLMEERRLKGKGNECERGKGKGRHDYYSADYDAIEDSLDDFIRGIEECLDDDRLDEDLGDRWIASAELILEQLPADDFTPFPTPTPRTFPPTRFPKTKPN